MKEIAWPSPLSGAALVLQQRNVPPSIPRCVIVSRKEVLVLEGKYKNIIGEGHCYLNPLVEQNGVCAFLLLHLFF